MPTASLRASTVGEVILLYHATQPFQPSLEKLPCLFPSPTTNYSSNYRIFASVQWQIAPHQEHPSLKARIAPLGASARHIQSASDPPDAFEFFFANKLPTALSCDIHNPVFALPCKFVQLLSRKSSPDLPNLNANYSSKHPNNLKPVPIDLSNRYPSTLRTFLPSFFPFLPLCLPLFPPSYPTNCSCYYFIAISSLSLPFSPPRFNLPAPLHQPCSPSSTR